MLMRESNSTRAYRDLIAWQKAMDLVPVIYSVTKKLPRKEQFGIASQIQRAVVSVPTNIAEGQAQGTSRHFANYLSIALGSLAELDTLKLICVRLG